MFKTRLISAVVIAAVMLLFAGLGGYYLAALLLAVSILGLHEFYNAVGLLPQGKLFDPLTIMPYAFSVVYYILITIFENGIFYMIFISVCLLLALLGAYVFTFPRYNIKDIVFAFYGYFYVSVMLSFIFLTRSIEGGIYVVWLIFFCSWFCDVFAYLTGMLFGKHKLAPVLSPKKSIEGAIGGIVVPAVCGAVYGYIINDLYMPQFPTAVAFGVLCAIGAAVSQIGDLSASAVKRNYDIKDYANLIPGHGGILDRFDSVIFTAPMIYFIAMFFTS